MNLLRLNRLGRIAITAAVAAALSGTAVYANALSGGPKATGPAPAQGPGNLRTPLAGTWTVADLGTPPPAVYSLRDIERTVSGDVIATDSDKTILCWNGTAWAAVPRPDIPKTLGAPIGAFGGVSCSDFFVFDTQDVPLRWHWDGRAWTSAPTGTKYPVRDFRAFAADDMVAVNNATPRTALRFDGSVWRSFPLPTSLSTLHEIGGTSGKDLWVFGKGPKPYDFVAFHWNGTAWTQTPIPAAFAKSGGARNVVAVSSKEVYVFDFLTTGGYLRWNGTSWQQGTITAPKDYINGAAYSAGTLWAGVGGGVLRLDNGIWTRSELPATVYDRGHVNVLGMAVDPRTGKVFAGGSAGGEQSPQGIVLQLQP